jgi:hypothetical protein
MWGQTSSKSESIALAIVVPYQTDYLDESQSVRLGKKITELVSKSGLSASIGGSNMVIYPVFSIENEELVEGGMQNITIIYADISLFIKQLDNNIIFASVSKQIKGSGSNRQKAISDIITKFSATESKLIKFVEEGKGKIIAYYETNCSNLLAKADACSKKKEYEEAIAILMSIPDVVSCYPQALKKSEEVYIAYQNQRCNELLKQAETYYAEHAYMDALSVLSELEVFNTKCSQEAKTLTKNIEAKISAQEKKEWGFMVKQQNDEVALEKHRVNAIRDIAKSYYNQKINYNYTVVVK